MPLDTNIKDTITVKLKENLQFLYMKLIDISHQHAGHNEEAKKGNTHFKLTIVAEKFSKLNLLQRHRIVNTILRYEFKKIHALKIDALSWEEYEKKYLSKTQV